MRRLSIISACVLGLIFASVIPGFGTTYMVTNTADAGAGSFRQAIIDAASGDTVKFDLTLLALGSDTIKLNSEISLNKALVIEGYYTSTDTLYISGQNANRILNINVSSGNVKISGLCLANGYNVSDGGAMRISGSANMQFVDCIFINNNTDADGGVFYKITGINIYFTDCTFINNRAVGAGGVCDLFAIDTAFFDYCTFRDNTAGSHGGALYAFGTVGISCTNSTFVNNTSGGSGGAMYCGGSLATVDLYNCTITGNSSSNGSGVYHFGSSIIFKMGSSIVLGNTGSNNVVIFGAGASATSFGYNVVGDATLMSSVPSDQLSVSAAAVNLGPLQDNGGTTYTSMPVSPSVAINLGTPTDFSDAQNGAITDVRRDAGSAEAYSCPVKYRTFYGGYCGSYTVPSGDETYNGPDPIMVNDTIASSCGSDSILTIIIIFNDIQPPIPDLATLPDTTAECQVTPNAPTATDQCQGPVTGTTGTPLPITANTTITWTFDDGLGNISTQNQNIFIVQIDTSVADTGITLTSNSLGGTYQWVDCNNAYAPLAGETNAEYTATANGAYAVIITKGACTDTSACHEISEVGIWNPELSFQVFPNPSNGVFTLELTEWSSLKYSVTNLFGQTLIPPTHLSGQKEILDLRLAEDGVYMLTLVGSNFRKTLPLIVQ